MSSNPFYDPPLAGPSGPVHVRFSRTELLHLGLSVLVLVVAFTLYNAKSHGGLAHLDQIDPLVVLGTVLAVGLGFILHEMAHKIVAQRYGHWAEFRAQLMGLGLTLLFAVGSPILFAAPGAVLIQGRVTPRENGIISIVGPATNLVITLIAYPLAWSTNPGHALPTIAGLVAQLNAVLGLFNLVPLGPLDGRKVLQWNKPVYAAAAGLALGLFILILVRPNGF